MFERRFAKTYQRIELLVLVPTPIGNLEDITYRAVKALRDADHIVAEDTRRSRKLLSHLGINSQSLHRLDANASERELDRVVGWMRNGSTVALVTDAGTPSVSDPGRALVAKASAAGIAVVSLPGPSAITAAVAASGLIDGSFCFMGFVPRTTAGLTELVGEIALRREPCVLFDSPNRLAATLHALASAMPSRQIVVAREMSKLHEELVRGTVEELASTDREWIGEITLVLGPWDVYRGSDVSDEEIDARIERELALSIHTKTVAAIVSAWSGRSRRDVYARIVRKTAGVSGDPDRSLDLEGSVDNGQ